MKLEITIDDKALTAALGRFGGSAINKIIRPSLEKRANDARREAVKGFVSRGLGRGIFGRNDSGAWKIIRLSPIEENGGNLSIKLSAVGLAGLQEMGGMMKAFRVPKVGTKVQAFQVAGTLQFASVTEHPARNVTKYESLKPAAEKILRLVVADTQPAIAALWERAA